MNIDGARKFIDDVKKYLRPVYDAEWRCYHNWSHVERMMGVLRDSGADDFSEWEWVLVELAVMFHDAVYYPWSKTNEKDSADYFSHVHFVAGNFVLGISDVEMVRELILSTGRPYQGGDARLAWLCDKFNDADWNGMGRMDVLDDGYRMWLNAYEDGIFREYQMYSVNDYVRGRLDFIEKSRKSGRMTDAVAGHLRSIIQCRTYNVGLYAGSFNPFHVGHKSILEKAEKIFDKVIVAKGQNPEKPRSMCDLGRLLPTRETLIYDCMLVDLLHSLGEGPCRVTLVRGIRNGYDLMKESDFIKYVNAQAVNRGMHPVNVVYSPCDSKYEHVSSSSVRCLPPMDASEYLVEPWGYTMPWNFEVSFGSRR